MKSKLIFQFPVGTFYRNYSRDCWLLESSLFSLVSADSCSVLWQGLLDSFVLICNLFEQLAFFLLCVWFLYPGDLEGKDPLILSVFLGVSLPILIYRQLTLYLLIFEASFLLTFWHTGLCILHVVPTYLFISYYLAVEERKTLLIKLILTSIPWSKNSLESL